MDAPQGRASGVRGTFCCPMFICQRNPASISAQAYGSHDSRTSWGLSLWGSSVQIICLRNVLHGATLSGLNVSFVVSSVPSILSHAWKKRQLHGQRYIKFIITATTTVVSHCPTWLWADSHMTLISQVFLGTSSPFFPNFTSVLP